MPFLLDTNIISEATKPRPNRKVMAWLMNHAAGAYISSITLGEIWYGIQKMPAGKTKNQSLDWFETQEKLFADSILTPDWPVMQNWGTYCAQLRREGQSLPLFDSLIAATAITHDLTIVTRNTADFPEVDVLNPWD